MEFLWLSEPAVKEGPVPEETQKAALTYSALRCQARFLAVSMVLFLETGDASEAFLDMMAKGAADFDLALTRFREIQRKLEARQYAPEKEA